MACPWQVIVKGDRAGSGFAPARAGELEADVSFRATHPFCHRNDPQDATCGHFIPAALSLPVDQPAGRGGAKRRARSPSRRLQWQSLSRRSRRTSSAMDARFFLIAVTPKPAGVRTISLLVAAALAEAALAVAPRHRLARGGRIVRTHRRTCSPCRRRFQASTLFLRAVRWRVLFDAEVRLAWQRCSGDGGRPLRQTFLPARAGDTGAYHDRQRLQRLGRAPDVLATALSERAADMLVLVMVSAAVLLDAAVACLDLRWPVRRVHRDRRDRSAHWASRSCRSRMTRAAHD